jgi:cytochrome c oxidase subunit 2
VTRGRKLLLLAVMAMALSACSLGVQDGVLDSFAPEGPIADDLAWLFMLVLAIAGVVFILVQGGLVFTLFRFRDRGGEEEPKQTEGNPVLEVLWTVIPVVILAAIAVPTVERVFRYTECAPDSMAVDVIGHQWWFEYYYPEHDVWTANELVIPAGQEVCLTMTSEDVLHNYWAPKLNGKRYLIPGEETVLLMEAYPLDDGVESEEFYVHCAEFCGLSHARMRARVIAVTETGFDEWVTAQKAEAVTPTDPLAEQGLTLFGEKGCSGCHLVRGVVDGTNEELIGPDLTHFASRGSFAGSTLEYEDPDALKMWLADPPTWKPGSFMPNLGLTADEIEALEAYLRSLK